MSFSLLHFSVLSLTTIISSFLIKTLLTIIQCRKNRKKSVGFFHPYTNDGGGGERVLWCAVKAIQELSPDLDCVIYTGDHDASPQSLAVRSIDRFGVHLIRPLKVVLLNKRKWIEETTYPRFTMIGQSLGSVYLSWEALCKFTPLYYFDTSGYAFTYPVARLFGCIVVCYTHYPTISLDMLSRVSSRSSMYNNDALIAKSVFFSRCKVVYYKLFSVMYGIVGSCAHLAMVNSSWTQSHIEKLWGIPARIKRVYPPCDTSGLQVLLLERSVEPMKIISVAQFRPEKAHPLQIEAFAVAIKNLDADVPRPKLQFVGSCRNEADEKRLQHLKDRAGELKLDNDVEFHKNVTYSELVRLLGGAAAGIHSMIDEHFGISVVEYMASGAIPIAHNSAGPRMDIVLPEDGKQTGFLASNVQEYADAILNIIRMPASERLEMASAARKRASRFSEQRFYQDFKAAIQPVMEILPMLVAFWWLHLGGVCNSFFKPQSRSQRSWFSPASQNCLKLEKTDAEANCSNTQANYQVVNRSNYKAASLNFPCLTPLRGEVGLRQSTEGKRLPLFTLAATSGNIVAETTDEDSKTVEKTYSDDKSSDIASSITSSTADDNVTKELSSEPQEADLAIQNQEPSEAKSGPSVKRAPLTARERLRAARVLNRYTESKPSGTPALGSKLIESLRDTDKGKKRPSLPEAPTNMLDDSKRGLSKGGWDITLPAGMDVYLIVFSFVLISTLMFATTFVVWKVGAIHFNEY